ncbi:SnoaL-like domain-containing protein [Chitinophaga sp. 22321]|uniref:Nuclear transport factor 2 family protein n=1 Tax=Chitinophaga hostae TaxID=2831022 RepID=A0ABS5IW95_9BACT|nr:nuclear transport factor 2 family protein [Chitinophaga hostae]MBS0027130.1 nuclear transport factor 2 family protein [Chitinophaga hostae]
MTVVKQVAYTLVQLCREWKFPEAQAALFRDDVVNIEPDGRITSGLAAIMNKERMFLDSIQTRHLLEISDPIVADDYFAVQLLMDVTIANTGRRTRNELCVYHVENGKIIREQFFY